MNKNLTKQRIKENGWSLAGWARRHGLSNQSVQYLLRDNRRKLDTGVQRTIIRKLKEDGLYVPSDDELDEENAA